MKVRIMKEPKGKRTYIVTSNDRRRPVSAWRSGVLPEDRKSTIADLVSRVAEKMRPGQPPAVAVPLTLGD